MSETDGSSAGNGASENHPDRIGAPVDEARLDEVLNLLAASPRREFLRVVRTADGEVPLSVAVERVAERRGDGQSRRSSPDPKQVELALRHVHLPKLRGTGVVTYDPDSEAVAYRPDPLVDDLLDRLPDPNS